MLNRAVAVLDYRRFGNDFLGNVAADRLRGDAQLSRGVDYGPVGDAIDYDHGKTPLNRFYVTDVKKVTDGSHPNEKNMQSQVFFYCHIISLKICVDRIE